MSSPAYVIAQHLDGQGFGTFADDIFVSREPAKPVEVMTVYDTGGLDPDTDGENVFVRTIQIRIRSTDYNATYETMADIRDNLLAASISGINGIWMQGDILPIGQDDNDRHIFTTNYRLLMEGI